jgi:hypothetical protein
LAKKGGFGIPRMNLAERESSETIPPSYKEGSLQELRIVPTRATDPARDLCHFRVVSRIDPKKVDLSRIALETDVLVIGEGSWYSCSALSPRRRSKGNHSDEA